MSMDSNSAAQGQHFFLDTPPAWPGLITSWTSMTSPPPSFSRSGAPNSVKHHTNSAMTRASTAAQAQLRIPPCSSVLTSKYRPNQQQTQHTPSMRPHAPRNTKTHTRGHLNRNAVIGQRAAPLPLQPLLHHTRVTPEKAHDAVTDASACHTRTTEKLSKAPATGPWSKTT